MKKVSRFCVSYQKIVQFDYRLWKLHGFEKSVLVQLNDPVAAGAVQSCVLASHIGFFFILLLLLLLFFLLLVGCQVTRALQKEGKRSEKEEQRIEPTYTYTYISSNYKRKRQLASIRYMSALLDDNYYNLDFKTADLS